MSQNVNDQPNSPHPDQPIPPIPEGPLNPPIYGPRLPGPGAVAPSGVALSPAQVFEPTLPVRPTSYPMFWRTPAWRWWRPIAGLVVGLLVVLLGSMIIMSAAIAFDIATGRSTIEQANSGITNLTAALFLGNNLVLASAIPVSFLISVLFFKQRPGWLSSVAGRLRWGWLGRCFLLITPIWLVYVGVESAISVVSGELGELAVNRDSWLLIVGILLTTPLQAAGEEFGFRGAIGRAVASFFGRQRAGLIVAALVSAAAFTVAHAAADMWLNLYYFSFGIAAFIVTWRTGGLEGAIAIHVVNNLFSEVFLPFSDISEAFNRDAGAAGPTMLIGIAVIAGASALLIWQAGRQGLLTEAAPAESMAAAQAAAAGSYGPGYWLAGQPSQPGFSTPQPTMPVQPTIPVQQPMSARQSTPTQPPAGNQQQPLSGQRLDYPVPPTVPPRPVSPDPRQPLDNPRPWQDG